MQTEQEAAYRLVDIATAVQVALAARSERRRSCLTSRSADRSTAVEPAGARRAAGAHKPEAGLAAHTAAGRIEVLPAAAAVARTAGHNFGTEPVAGPGSRERNSVEEERPGWPCWVADRSAGCATLVEPFGYAGRAQAAAVAGAAGDRQGAVAERSKDPDGDQVPLLGGNLLANRSVGPQVRLIVTFQNPQTVLDAAAARLHRIRSLAHGFRRLYPQHA